VTDIYYYIHHTKHFAMPLPLVPLATVLNILCLALYYTD
jgi:hypothetical protein